MDDRRKRAFDFAQETTKQVITLSTGVLALTITFLKDIAKDAPEGATVWIHWAWGLYLASVFFGMVTLMTLTGNLERAEGTPSIYARNIVVPSAIQILTFVAGLALTLVFGVKAT